jgi:4a-hydroxytetrahydrobiopterin dehydratase
MPNETKKECVDCEGGFPALTKEQATDLLPQVPEWKMNDAGTELSREFKFDDFAQALAFVDKVGALADEAWHHPAIELSWGRVRITLSTHSVHGLSESDFIMGMKINTLNK